jgi:hypothetical protein
VHIEEKAVYPIVALYDIFNSDNAIPPIGWPPWSSIVPIWSTHLDPTIAINAHPLSLVYCPYVPANSYTQSWSCCKALAMKNPRILIPG